PKCRSSFGIFSSCITTMLLCVWTAIHLNIPAKGGFAIEGLIYSVIHLLARNAPFHSRTEQLLWRISGCILDVSGFAIPLVELASSMV
ncbi:hypothetical protein K469DRAFT_519079, partial [Zopfia rhizophila CBS 207.26]